MNICENDGYLVGAQAELPSDPTDFMWIGREPTVGCNRLRCAGCGETVRQNPGWLVRSDELLVDRRARIDELRRREDWDGLTYVRRDDTYRIYVCRCGYESEDFREPLAHPEADDGPGRRWIQFRCAGHPGVALPFVIDGVTLSTVDEVVAAARRGFAGWRPEPMGAAEVRGTWTSRLHGRAQRTELASRIERLTVECFSDGDERIRAGALRFLRRHRNLDGDRVAVSWALDGPSDPSPLVRRELANTVAAVWEYGLVEDARIGRYVLANAVYGEVVEHAVDALAVRERTLLRDSAETIVRATPSSAPKILRRVFEAFAYEDQTMLDLAAKLVRIPGVDLQALRRFARTQVSARARDGFLRIVDEAEHTS